MAKSLTDQLAQGPVICAEGYLFELERRGYLQAGAFVPEVVLEHPEVVKQLHKEFVRAGSDVVQAFTYYGHREKLRTIGKEHLLEPLNRGALKIAKEVADETGTLMAGNICNTNIYDPEDEDTHEAAVAMFDEQVAWAKEDGANFIIGETFSYMEEALLALKAIKDHGMEAVITLAVHRDPVTREDMPVGEACKQLADNGADVVGLNCARGPESMLSLLEEIVASVDVPVAALPVPYRTSEAEPSFQSLHDSRGKLPDHIERPFPTALDPFTCNRYEVADFTERAKDIGVQYFGLCCGAAPHHLRAMSEALGRETEASRYSADMSRHAFLGTNTTEKNREFGKTY